MPTLESLDAQIEQYKAAQAELAVEMAPFQARWRANYERLSALKEQWGEAKVEDMTKNGPDWKYLVRAVADNPDVPSGGMPVHLYFGKTLRDLYFLWHSGYRPETGEASLHLWIDNDLTDAEKEDRITRIVKGVELFAKVLTPLKDGFVHFPFFLNGWEVQVKPDLSVIQLALPSRYDKGSVYPATTIKDAVEQYLKHFCRSGKSSDDDEADYANERY